MDAAWIGAFRAIPLFSERTDEALTDLARSTTVFEAPAGRVLVEGQTGSGLLVIEDGKSR